MKTYLPFLLIILTSFPVSVFAQLLAMPLEQTISPNRQDTATYTDQTFHQALEASFAAITADTVNITLMDPALLQLRYYSYYRGADALDDASLTRLHDLLLHLSQAPYFWEQNNEAWRLQEHFSVLSQRFMLNSAINSHAASHITTLQKLALSPPTNSSELAWQYAWLEAMRALGFIAVQARTDDNLRQLYTQAGQWQEICARISTTNDWQLEHLLWLMAYRYLLLPENQQPQWDKHIIQQLTQHPQLATDKLKQLFSQRYLVNSFRTRGNCEQEFAGLCQLPEISQALPITYQCGQHIRFRAKNISQQQLHQSCNDLLALEENFHGLLQTRRQPVADDVNATLEVIVFDNYSDYNLFGALHYDIRTNNGGFYVEGQPNAPDNQARFFSFQRFWQTEPFHIWNLQHEYIHYLDGRYNAYGPFGHFPSHKVWWAEGLAELISMGTENPKALALLHTTLPAEQPTLAKIFATEYADGVDMTYRWSYLAWRFIQQHGTEFIPQLADFLRKDNFTGYRTLLDNIARTEQQAFFDFLQQVRKTTPPASTNSEVHYQGRYLYRSYLQPGHLPVTAEHFHLLQVPGSVIGERQQ